MSAAKFRSALLHLKDVKEKVYGGRQFLPAKIWVSLPYNVMNNNNSSSALSAMFPIVMAYPIPKPIYWPADLLEPNPALEHLVEEGLAKRIAVAGEVVKIGKREFTEMYHVYFPTVGGMMHYFQEIKEQLWQERNLSMCVSEPPEDILKVAKTLYNIVEKDIRKNIKL